MFRFSLCLVLCACMGGCATAPPADAASRQQAEADLVVNFQSWNCIFFVKPDFTGTPGALPAHIKTFTRAAVVKLLRNLDLPRDFVVVVLDRRHEPDPMVANGGMDAIQAFFQGLGFKRIAFQDGTAVGRAGKHAILRDTLLKPPSASEAAGARGA